MVANNPQMADMVKKMFFSLILRCVSKKFPKQTISREERIRDILIG